MQHPRWHIPTCSGYQRKSLGVHRDFIIPFGKVHQTLLDLFLGGPWGDPEKRIRKIPPVIVDLRRKIIGFGFPFLANFCRMLVIVVNMVRKRSHIVKKLGIHWPALVFIPEPVTNDFTLQFVYRILQQKLFFRISIRKNHMAQPLVLAGEWAVFSWCGGGKPTLINSSTLTSQDIIIIGMQLDPPPGYAK